MFFITFSNLWTLSCFFSLTYLIFVLSAIIYVLPTLTSSLRYTSSRTKSDFYFINGQEIFWVILTPFLLIGFMTMIWGGPTTSAWFGHIVVNSFQTKMTWLITVTFLTVTLVSTQTWYFTSREVYDYLITTFNFFYWLVILFYSNSIFTSIFVIEVLSALIFLLLITSTFSSTFFYRNTSLSFGHLFQNSTPYSYMQALLYFFWVSLISSLNLFLFCLLFYTKILTFDWYLMEHVFIYFVNASSAKDIFALGISWFVLVFCIFLKCGVAPLYIWKPTFFKGIPFYTIFFYITFFYFFLFLFIIHLMTAYFSEVFYFYTTITFVFLFTGLFSLVIIVCETYYFKAFLAISSILNSLFVLLALTNTHPIDLVFWL